MVPKDAPYHQTARKTITLSGRSPESANQDASIDHMPSLELSDASFGKQNGNSQVHTVSLDLESQRATSSLSAEGGNR